MHSALLPRGPCQQNSESVRRQRRHARTITGDHEFYGKWIAANGIAEAAGLGATFLLGGAAAPLLARTETLAEVLLAGVIAVLLGTLLEGVVVGVAQGSVLRVRAPEVTLRSWIAATAVGAGLAWMVGMIPSSVMALTETSASGSPVEEPALLIRLLFAAGLGFVTGPILGVAQWVVLRRKFDRAGSWLWANAFAWALGMPVIFAGMDLVPWEGSGGARATAIVSLCLVAGLVVGTVHGSVLVRLTRPTPWSAAV